LDSIAMHSRKKDGEETRNAIHEKTATLAAAAAIQLPYRFVEQEALRI